MNILVIGNGFDLAHGLPTKYSHFLDFCKRIFPIYQNEADKGVDLYKKEYLSQWDFNKDIKDKMENAYKSRKVAEKKICFQTDYPRLDEMYSLIKDNLWIEYFQQCNTYQKENWIDFEAEVSRVVRVLEIVNRKIGKSSLFSVKKRVFKWLKNLIIFSKLTVTMLGVRHYIKKTEEYSEISDYNDIIKCFKIKEKLKTLISDDQSGSTYQDDFCKFLTIELKKNYENDLNRLIRSFEIYLCEFIFILSNCKISPDIKGIKPSKIISFNYTCTYKKYYDLDEKCKYDYIHGEAKIDNTLETNNMVLGINEYLPQKRRDRETEFIAFKKYFQRIYKGTGCNYKEWIDEIRNDYIECIKNEEIYIDNCEVELKKIEEAKKEKHKLSIFGHSLDVTDKDILRELILNDNVYTTIYYPDKEELGRKIAKLVKVIGQDELIKRTGGSTKTIEFKLQQPMMPIEKVADE